MKDAQKPDHISLNTLISRLREGRFVIPDFQREFEWRPWDIRELMRSIFLDYYIGSLLLWKGKKENLDALSCESIYGYKGNASPEYIVLDGQQRLTALHYAFLSPEIPLPNRSSRFFYYLRVDRFMEEQYDEAFHYDSVTKKWSNVLADRDSQYAEHIFPMGIIGAGNWELPNWVQGYVAFWKEKLNAAKTAVAAGDATASEKVQQLESIVANANDFGDHVRGITEQYQISYIELDKDLAVDKVCDIFTQINSRGVRLDVFDLFNALLKPKGLQLKQMYRNASSKLEFVDTDKMNVYILQVMSILKQTYCSPKYLYYLLPGQEKQVRDAAGARRKEVLISQASEFESHWNKAVSALEEAIKVLKHPQEFGAISSKYLPYISILPVFAALQEQIRSLAPPQRLDARRKFSHWYWASVFNNRYSGSVESTSARDFNDLRSWFSDDAAEPALITEFKARSRSLDLKAETKSGTSVYNGVFNLLIIQGARDWMNGGVAQHDDLDDHHIVPASWGAKNLKGNRIHTILNRTPLTADTNRNVISDRLPNEYLPELIQASGQDVVAKMMDNHFISEAALQILLRDPFTPDDFEDFISERQRTIQAAMESLLIKERLDLSPQLRELDEAVEKVELSLRDVIATSLGNDESLLPPHVLVKANERINAAAKKNAAMDLSSYQTLHQKLEFCDLRELQDTISSKALTENFQQRFGNKEALAVKFGQLADLRNGIRHSRTVNEIARKEGEAAVLWFQEILKKPATA